MDTQEYGRFGLTFAPDWGVKTWTLTDPVSGRTLQAREGWPRPDEDRVCVLGYDEQYMYLYIPDFGWGAFNLFKGPRGGALIAGHIKYVENISIPTAMLPSSEAPKTSILARIGRLMRVLPPAQVVEDNIPQLMGGTERMKALPPGT